MQLKLLYTRLSFCAFSRSYAHLPTAPLGPEVRRVMLLLREGVYYGGPHHLESFTGRSIMLMLIVASSLV